MNTDIINELVEAAEKWVTSNEFGGYNGSLRSLVAWFTKVDRHFQWISMAEVDEATKILMEKLNREPVTIKEKSPRNDAPTSKCISCGRSLVGTKHNDKTGNLCQECYDLSHGCAVELLDEDKFVSKID